MKRNELWYWLRMAPVLSASAALVVYLWGCPKPIPKPRPGEPQEPPRISPLPIPENVRLKPNPQSLPSGARALFPGFDGDAFYVTLPKPKEATTLSWRQVFNDVVAPTLRAVGFERSSDEILVPNGNGVNLPRAKLDTSLTNPTLLEFSRQQIDQIRRLRPGQIDTMVQMGEGMTFQQYKADIERLEIEYPFRQVVKDVPIEHTMVVASRWEGETVTSITGRVFNKYVVTNQVKLTSRDAARRVLEALRKVKGITDVTKEPPNRVELLLLPYGAAQNVAALRYSYRMPVQAQAGILKGIWYTWLDAENGRILELQPLVDETSAQGRTFRRAPDLLPTTNLVSFEVDPAAGGQYTLQLSSVMNRVDFQGDGFNANDVSISNSTNGSSGTFANFDQATNGINDATNAVCNNDAGGTLGADETFQQVDFFAVIYNQYRQALNAGIFTPFPTFAWSPVVEQSGFCNANSGMVYGACNGYYDADCPDGVNKLLNFAHDHTVVAHELAHNMTSRQYTDRPIDWCVGPSLEPGTPVAPCPVPTGQGLFHDHADAWADAFENTNCLGGWVIKNQTASNASLNCIANTDEGGFGPRLHQVTVPFNPAIPGDHFPEHRTLATGGYADGQISAAALWQVRAGMRSKCRPSGTPQYLVRFMRALRTTGWFSTTPSGNDKGIYRALVDLEVKMLNQWATSGSPGGPPAFSHNGAHTSSKVTSGFAKAGIFLIPAQCIDGDATTSDPIRCPSGELGADAVVDINDNDTADDPVVDGVTHPEVDYLEQTGGAPTFHVWTGPRYKFSGTSATFPNPSPCNSRFQVEVANNDAFTLNVITSGFITVDTDPTTPAPECYGTWTPTGAQWATVNPGDRIYYRVRTQNAVGGDERVSTQPGQGLYSVPPPYAIINATGTPAGCAVAHFEHFGGTTTQRTIALLLMWLPLAVIVLLRRRARQRA